MVTAMVTAVAPVSPGSCGITSISTATSSQPQPHLQQRPGPELVEVGDGEAEVGGAAGGGLRHQADGAAWAEHT